MIPIQELLSRMRWDPQFARADLRIGYYDRVAGRVITVGFRDLRFPPDDRFAFTVIDDEGEVHTVPYHRVREVYRDGRLIWRRGA